MLCQLKWETFLAEKKSCGVLLFFKYKLGRYSSYFLKLRIVRNIKKCQKSVLILLLTIV